MKPLPTKTKKNINQKKKIQEGNVMNSLSTLFRIYFNKLYCIVCEENLIKIFIFKSQTNMNKVIFINMNFILRNF